MSGSRQVQVLCKKGRQAWWWWQAGGGEVAKGRQEVAWHRHTKARRKKKIKCHTHNEKGMKCI